MKDAKKFVEQCEGDVRDGRAHLVIRRLAALNMAELPREIRLPLAQICDRAGATSLGLKLLAPLVYPERKHFGEAKAEEIAEYAVLLQRIGSTPEALSLLSNLPELDVAFLYRAYCHFSRWEYKEAVPLLDRYLQSDLEPYRRSIGRVNLAAALVILTDFDRATDELNRLTSELKQANHNRLLGNCFELQAQIHIQKKDFKKAINSLNEAERIFSEERTFDHLFVQKWRAIISAYQSKDIQALVDFKRKAADHRHWESVREADRYILQLQFSQNLFEHLLFGTPYDFYRERVQAECGNTLASAEFEYGTGDPCLDVTSGELDNGKVLTSGGKVHQLTAILLRDFYRPIHLGSLFTELFPEERFNVYSSPDRVHQVLRRSRVFFKKNRFPVAIEQDNNSYFLALRGPCRFRIPFVRQIVDPKIVQFGRLRESPERPELFSTDWASKALEVHPATFQRLAQWAISRGYLETVRNGRSIRYRFVA